MTSTSGSTSGSATPTSGGSAAKPPVPDLTGIENAITALHEFLRNGQATADRNTFTEPQLAIEDDFRALLGGLRRPGSVPPPGRFFWRVLVKDRLELAEPLPAEVQEIGAYAADRRKVWRVVAAMSTDRRELVHPSITPEGVVRLRAFDHAGRRVLIGFPLPNTPSPT